MNSPNFKTRLPILALLLCGTFAAVPAWAAPTTDPAELAELAARNRQERVDCMSLPQGGARADCVRDTNVAYAHAKRNRPNDIDPPFAENVTRRCDALSGDENSACLARMSGEGTISGSVAEGGIYRELVIVETMAEPTPAALPAASIAPMTPAAPMTTPMAPMPTPVTPAAPAATALPSATNPTTPK